MIKKIMLRTIIVDFLTWLHRQKIEYDTEDKLISAYIETTDAEE